MARPTRTAASSSDACPEVAFDGGSLHGAVLVDEKSQLRGAHESLVRPLGRPGLEKGLEFALHEPFYVERVLNVGQFVTRCTCRRGSEWSGLRCPGGTGRPARSRRWRWRAPSPSTAPVVVVLTMPGIVEGWDQRCRVRLQCLLSGQCQTSLSGLPYCLVVSKRPHPRVVPTRIQPDAR